uniref:Uncharacterized protein n=1 Tax=Ditylenchus dipsaci TaxID=166011 RepID=A0A915D950_9BILA
MAIDEQDNSDMGGAVSYEKTGAQRLVVGFLHGDIVTRYGRVNVISTIQYNYLAMFCFYFNRCIGGEKNYIEDYFIDVKMIEYFY